eukprot:jgi/Ulvmu1/8527/UM044_0061.1
MIAARRADDSAQEITCLSIDALQCVFSHMSVRDRACVASVCWSWRLAARRAVRSLRLCASTPYDYPTIYPNVRQVHVCDPSLAAACGATPVTLLHLQRLAELPNLRSLDLSGLSILRTDSDITTVCTILQNVLPRAFCIDTITLPNTTNQPLWDLSWLYCISRICRVDLNGNSVDTVMPTDVILSIPQIQTLTVRLTEDVPTQHKDLLVSLRDVTISFGHGEHAPSAANTTELLQTCTAITKLHFAFSQSFRASQRLMEAVADLPGLQDLQLNGFDITEMTAGDLQCMSQLSCLERLELSGMNLVGERLHTWLPHLTSLTQLTLALAIPATWESLFPVSLKELELSSILQSGRRCHPSVLAALTQLTCLKINCSRGINDVFVRDLKALTRLQTCTFMVTNVTGSTFKYISWEHLTFLSIGSAFDDSNFVHIGTAFPHLTDLHLVQCKRMSTLAGLQTPALTKVVITGKHRLTLRGLMPLEACAALQCIRVTWSSTSPRPQRGRTTAAQLLQALSSLSSLTELSLRGSSGPWRARADPFGILPRLLQKLPGIVVTRRSSPQALQPAVPPLRQLSMAGCDAVRDHDLAVLAASPLVDHLTLLNLSGCVKLTGRGFDSIASLQALRRLDLSQCPRLSDVAMLKLTNTHAVPDKRHPNFMPGLQSLLMCTWTYVHAAVHPSQCHRRIAAEEDRVHEPHAEEWHDQHDPTQASQELPARNEQGLVQTCSRDGPYTQFNDIAYRVCESTERISVSEARQPDMWTTQAGRSQTICEKPDGNENGPENMIDGYIAWHTSDSWTEGMLGSEQWHDNDREFMPGDGRNADAKDGQPKMRPLPALRELNLACDQAAKHQRIAMSGVALQCLRALHGLEWLNLDARPLDLTTVDALSASLTRLTYLSLDNCYGAGPELKQLAQFVLKLAHWPELREVSIRDMVVLPETVSEIHRCRPTLSLWHNGMTTTAQAANDD